jgi:phosphopantetheine--protein transferase-like protein
MVRVRTGIDLVVIEQFAGSLRRGGEAFLRRLFHPSEAAGASTERLAAIFAAKEAAFKALELPPGNWLVLELRHSATGRPWIRFDSGYDSAHIVSCDLSITHAAGYVVASAVALVSHAADD